MLLTAAAPATSRIRLGTLLTPVPRYRPQQLARQVATLDHLTGGRMLSASGLDGPIEDRIPQLRRYRRATPPSRTAGRRTGTVEALLAGEPVNHHGRHYKVRDVTPLPATVQRPGPPVWIGGFRPRRPPTRRAARWDGAVPLFETARHGHVPDVAAVRDSVDHVRKHRTAGAERPFEFVLGGATPPDTAKAKDVIRSAARCRRRLVGRATNPDQPPRYLFRGSAMGPPAFGSGMTSPPCCS
ncbi:LLM class flavin-dependent oxidoreductase [Streptomyces nodosus]